MSTYRSNNSRDVAIADEFLSSFRPCTFCGISTPYADLADLGARCRSCFHAFCTQGRHFPPLSPDDRRSAAEALRRALSSNLRPSSRQFVENLQARADAGERLTSGQRGFLEAARRNSGVQNGTK